MSQAILILINADQAHLFRILSILEEYDINYLIPAGKNEELFKDTVVEKIKLKDLSISLMSVNDFTEIIEETLDTLSEEDLEQFKEGLQMMEDYDSEWLLSILEDTE